MFLNIITPCTRPDNLMIISDSINIPKGNYRWIVIFDSEYLSSILICFPDFIPDNCECYAIKDFNSISGNAQRNYGLSLVEDGHVYFNDDDTTIYKDLWENIKDLDNDFISFSQAEKDGSLRLYGKEIEVNKIDSHCFIVSNDLIKDSIFTLDKYDADGFFAKECFIKSKNSHFIDKVLSVYNSIV